MKILVSVLTVLALAFVCAGTALADGGGDTVIKTFELTVNGTPPADAALVVSYLEEGDDPETGGALVVLCGDTDRLPAEDREGLEVLFNEPCEGDGTRYTYEVEFPRGTAVAFFFARASVVTEEEFEIFASTPLDAEGNPLAYETLNADVVNAAAYDFGTAQLPSTGLSEAASRFSLLAAALSVVALGAWIRRLLPQA